MPYITSVERLAREEGFAEGLEREILQNPRGYVIYILKDRFTEVPQELVDRVNQIKDNELLKVLLKQAFAIAPVVYGQEQTLTRTSNSQLTNKH